MSTVTASCVCGNIKATITGPLPLPRLPQDLRLGVQPQRLSARQELHSRTPKEFTKTADSGGVITSHFCGDCGTTLWRSGPFFPGGKIVKTGIVDDLSWVGNRQATAELFPERKTAWVPNLVKS
ncbi:hypothetical protein V492_06403 [Pseudogymnoascus sp. VKM F-4246]|nr:hypothetical protein V492_06403 [Pseudogymnoascus sp. VKM F-4246]